MSAPIILPERNFRETEARRRKLKGKETKQIGLHILLETYRQLDRLAAAHGITMSETIDRLVARFSQSQQF